MNVKEWAITQPNVFLMCPECIRKRWPLSVARYYAGPSWNQFLNLNEADADLQELALWSLGEPEA